MSNKYGTSGYATITGLTAPQKAVTNIWFFTFNWKNLETAVDTWNWSTFDAQILAAIADGYYVSFIVLISPNTFAPSYLFSAPYSVPIVTTTSDSYPYYFNPSTFDSSGTYAFKTRYNNMLDQVRAHVSTLQAYLDGKILFWQSAEGTTGDEVPYHGTITGVTINGTPVATPSLYNITDTAWDSYKHTLWLQQNTDISTDIGLTTLMINPANNGQNWAWKQTNLPNVYIKSGDFSHNYSFIGESYYADFVQSQNALGFTVRGEIDSPPLGDAWWDSNPNQNTMALVACALNAGINNFNVAVSAYAINATANDAYQFYSDFARVNSEDQTTGFIYFRDVLDFADTTRFPEGTYGNVIDPASQATYNAKVAIVNASTKPAAVKLWNITLLTVTYYNPARITAIQVDYPTALFGVVNNRDGDQYNNDFGCDTWAGSWTSGITIYNQYDSTTPHWRYAVDPLFLGRYGLSIDTEMFASVDFATNQRYTATFKISYFDGTAPGIVNLNYFNGSLKTTADTISLTGTNTIIEKTITVSNFYGGANLPNSNDFSLEYVSGNNIIFGLLKLSVIPNPITPMANLAAYIDFSIEFDKSVTTPVMRLTDPNNYPAPVYLYMTGIFTITQPDGVTITGSFTSPDIYWSSAGITPGLVVAEKELRLSTSLAIQKGTYTFVYTVRCTGYTDTVLTKTFSLIYDTPTISITDLTDVFTPSLKQLDSTIYTQPNFPVVSVVRSWSADIRYVGTSAVTITGSLATFNMSYGGNYWDARYLISFSSVMTTTGIFITYLTIIDKISTTYTLDAYSPPTLTTLLTELNTLYTQITDGTYCGGNGCGCCDPIDYSVWTEASQLYQSIISDGLAGNTVGLYAKVVQLEKIYYCGIYNPTHTNAIIPPYSFTATIVVLQSAVFQTIFTATVDNTTVTDAIPELIGATIISAVRDIYGLTPAQYELDNTTGIVTLLGGGSNFLDTGGNLYIIYSIPVTP